MAETTPGQPLQLQRLARVVWGCWRVCQQPFDAFRGQEKLNFTARCGQQPQTDYMG